MMSYTAAFQPLLCKKIVLQYTKLPCGECLERSKKRQHVEYGKVETDSQHKNQYVQRGADGLISSIKHLLLKLLGRYCPALSFLQLQTFFATHHKTKCLINMI